MEKKVSEKNIWLHIFCKNQQTTQNNLHCGRSSVVLRILNLDKPNLNSPISVDVDVLVCPFYFIPCATTQNTHAHTTKKSRKNKRKKNILELVESKPQKSKIMNPLALFCTFGFVTFLTLFLVRFYAAFFVSGIV